MKLAEVNVLYAGGQGSGCNPAVGVCGRKKYLSQDEIKEEVTRLTPYLQRVGNAWKKRIKEIDPKAKMEISVSPTGLFTMKDMRSPMVLQSTYGANVFVNGKSSSGEHFMLGMGIYPEPNGNSVKMQDSSLPDKWQGKGVFSAGLKVLTGSKSFNLNHVMYVHMDTNPKVWTRLAKKHGLKYEIS